MSKMSKVDKAFWHWFTEYGLYGTHHSGKTVLDLDDEEIPDFIPIYNDEKELVRYELDC